MNRPHTYQEHKMKSECKPGEHSWTNPEDDGDYVCLRCGTKEKEYKAQHWAQFRPSWDEIWMGMAHELSRRSIDPRAKVGCLIVSDDNTQVLALGYNGDQKGGANSVESLEPGKSGTIHAEENALIKCPYRFDGKKVMYISWSPCDQCAKKIINAGIHEVIYDRAYRDPAGVERLKKAGILIRRYRHPAHRAN